MPGFSGQVYVSKIKALSANFVRVAKNLRTISLEPEGERRGNALLSYVLDPFLQRNKTPSHLDPVHWHSNSWECRQMAQILLEMGFAVDAISCWNHGFVPRKDYSIFIDVRYNMRRLAPQMGDSCLKIMHIDVADILFQNVAEGTRLLQLQARRGVTLGPVRFEMPNGGLHVADCGTVIGNRFTTGTFAYARKPLYPIPVTPTVTREWPENKDFERCRRNFLWLGSSGFVRKGLDLVLEAFAGMPEYTLTVCGAIRSSASAGRWGALGFREEAFERSFHKELFDTPNIHSVGWVDVTSARFKEIADSCVAIVYPSCCEGQCGAVINAMHMGLLPLVSYETGVDVDDFGWILPNSSVRDIQDMVRYIASLPSEQLKDRSRLCWEVVRAKNSRATFTEAYRFAIEDSLARYMQRAHSNEQQSIRNTVAV